MIGDDRRDSNDSNLWNMPTLSRGPTFSREDNRATRQTPEDLPRLGGGALPDVRVKINRNGKTRQHCERSGTPLSADDYSTTDSQFDSDLEDDTGEC